ncbi:MAG TPA: BREX-2 system adenine-specific DNA-methyltransferase PglX [Mycobacteriales bacterium]|nr:BREX-2 system adenine-specific DNA-methyltransferase PglX [Mycobacteriales bacterium]
MSARDTLTPELRAEVLRLEDDLRARVASMQEVQDAWRAEYDAARAAERTAAAWEAWVDERVTLAAVAWVLTTVFVRFCEDNDLIKPVWISGPRHREAIDAQQQFLRETARINADVTDREWLLQAIDYLKSLPATAGLVDDTSPMWLVPPSGDAATRLLNFWRERDESGVLIRDLADPDLDTRFLGDLYQDISEDAKKRYALLQTPVFVEEFILDRTLEPALNERPLEGFKMIDPTCGSGHFLLGGFLRLLDRWHKHAPGLDERERVQAALDSVYGVDINPFAIAIARFRITVAALQACGLSSLEDAPSFEYHLAAGDSLLHGLAQEEFDLGSRLSVDKVAANFAYATENLRDLRSILKSGQYDVVVGNPPYITVKDSALNKLYRERYMTCHRQYALSVPFMERFYLLAKSGSLAGWTGQITSNSFMKREFGGPLIEAFLPTKDLRFVIDSEGAWIPGHNMDGTPTVILVGRNARPVSSSVRAVLSKTRRETPTSAGGSGPYWQAIVQNIETPGYDSDWISVVDLDRSRLAKHPWSLTGGGAIELQAALETGRRLASLNPDLGRTTHTGGDEAFYLPPASANTLGLADECVPVVLGDGVRDFLTSSDVLTVFPYDAEGKPREPGPAAERWFWPNRTVMRAALDFGKTRTQRGLRWFDHSMFFPARFSSPYCIATAFIASHNHFVLERQGKVFNRSAPVLVLPSEHDVARYHELLGLLNSSTVCFWLKQNSQPKGGAADHPWSRTYEFTSTTLADLPIPKELVADRGDRLDRLARELNANLPAVIAAKGVPTRAALDVGRQNAERVRMELISEMEEIDWVTYRSYGLIDEDLACSGEVPGLAFGERAFEIALGRRLASGSEESGWFSRHGARPLTDLPASWPADYRSVVAHRIEMIESNARIQLIERPEFKRRWASFSWEEEEKAALHEWLLGRIESRTFWFDHQQRPTPQSLAVLSDQISRDEDLTSVLALWDGRVDVPVVDALTRLVANQGVPYLAANRYKESGLRKRKAWEATWDLQRMEDAGSYRSATTERGDGSLPVPPGYVAADFQKPEYWSHRGKLDVPKERLILYLGAGREGDPTPVIGWAGWDHAQQALALATLIQSGEQQGWSEERLTPLVAGLSELLPWVEQWHTDSDPLYGGSSPAEFFSELLDSYMAKLGATRESLAAWRPPAVSRDRKAKS